MVGIVDQIGDDDEMMVYPGIEIMVHGRPATISIVIQPAVVYATDQGVIVGIIRIILGFHIKIVSNITIRTRRVSRVIWRPIPNKIDGFGRHRRRKLKKDRDEQQKYNFH